MTDILERAVATYLSDMGAHRSLGAGVKELSYYPMLAELLNAVGSDLNPKVLCLSALEDTGAGHPDFGLFTKTQCQRGEPRPGQTPERGVVEVKSLADETLHTAETKQISKYWQTYRLVLVTNYRDFLLVGEDHGGQPARLEGFRIAQTEAEFWEVAATPRKTARRLGQAFGEYLRRALTLSVSLREPKDVAWFIASYARDALQRVEDAGRVAALATVRQAFEEALGIEFSGEKGDHFFRSSLVQTLFYGVFSAWVLWARQIPRPSPRFDWRTAVWHLKVPMLRALFQQLADPGKLEPLKLVEVLDWTANTLNRVLPEEFFARFNDAEAVQFFYEPFLEAFDPELRKQLGVWYTPTEVVTYMVARVDKALREDLGVADGLAADNVYVLDPCCGTGAYLAAVLRRIDATLEDRGYGALRGQIVKKAATSRVFGFEIMPAPFVVSHLQIGLLLQQLGAPFADDGVERAGVYLTNALTGWEPVQEKPLPFPELEEERQRSDAVKQDVPILVILGNPPYNGYAGMAMHEERALSEAYRTTNRVRRPEGQGLNDLYVRFYRMAERRIAEKTGQGVVCFISNYSWLDGLSFTGMRERYLEMFDAIRIDCLNGDKYKTGKRTPDGLPDPSIFSTEHNREGIQVGTAIATLIRKAEHQPAETIGFRDLWGAMKRRDLLETAERGLAELYADAKPPLELGLPFSQAAVGIDYLNWPRLPDLFPVSFPGVKTSRDEFLVSIDRQTLEKRLAVYFDPSISHAELRRRFPSVMKASGRYNPETTRDILLKRGAIKDNIVRYAYRPFDGRWLYWEPETKLLDEKRSEYWPHVFPRNLFVEARQKQPKEEFSRGSVVSRLADNFGNGLSHFFPAFLRHEHAYPGATDNRPNVSKSTEDFFTARGLGVLDLFHHVVAVLHAPAYRSDNAAALRMDWPRVPLPETADTFRASSKLGQELAALLNSETPVPGATVGALRPELRLLGVPSKVGSGGLREDDFALTAGWGSTQSGGIVMPGRGKAVQREYRPDEVAAFGAASGRLGMPVAEIVSLLGENTVDVYLNEDAFWSNVPARVWAYTLGGYQVVKKWLSYRERDVLGRNLKPDEITYVSEMVRRIAAILLLGPRLDANYEQAKAHAPQPETRSEA